MPLLNSDISHIHRMHLMLVVTGVTKCSHSIRFILLQSPDAGTKSLQPLN